MNPAEFPEKLKDTYTQLGKEIPEITFKSPAKAEL